MTMLWFMKIMGWALSLSEVLSDLKAVKAKAPETTAADYSHAAAAVLGQPGIDAWLARVEEKYGAGKADAIRAELPFVLWAIDFATER
jgi:hypothetical protein